MHNEAHRRRIAGTEKIVNIYLLQIDCLNKNTIFS